MVSLAEAAARHAGARICRRSVRHLPAEPRPDRQHASSAIALHPADGAGPLPRADGADCCSGRRRRCCFWARSSPRPRRSCSSPITKPELAAAGAQGPARVPRQFRSMPTDEAARARADPHDARRSARSKLDWSERAEHNVEASRSIATCSSCARDDPVIRAAGRREVDGAMLSAHAFVLRLFDDEHGDRLLVVNLGRDLPLDATRPSRCSHRPRTRSGSCVVQRGPALRRPRTSRCPSRDDGPRRLAAPPQSAVAAGRGRGVIPDDSIKDAQHRAAWRPSIDDPRTLLTPRVAGHQRARRLRVRHRLGRHHAHAITACSSPRCRRRLAARHDAQPAATNASVCRAAACTSAARSRDDRFVGESHRYLTEFRLDSHAGLALSSSTTSCIEKCIVMPHSQNTVYVHVPAAAGTGRSRLQLRPSFAFRPHDDAGRARRRDALRR